MRTIAQGLVFSALLVGFTGCGGNTGVKEPENFVPMPEQKTPVGKESKLKSLNSGTGGKANSVPLKK